VSVISEKFHQQSFFGFIELINEWWKSSQQWKKPTEPKPSCYAEFYSFFL
jgi:hypothetical protein